MPWSAPNEFHFLLDQAGSVIVYQEKDSSWAGLLAFSSAELAREFVRVSRLDVSEIATIAAAERESIGAIIDSVKKRAVRNLLLDLDFRTGECTMVEFEGNQLAAAHPWRFTPKAKE